MDYNVTTAPSTNSSNLFAAAVNIVIPPKDFLFLGLAAAWLCLLFAASGHIWAAILPQIYILPHFLTWQRMVKINKGKELNIILGETSRNMLLFGILLTLGLIL